MIKNTPQNPRLSAHVNPLHYSLVIKPDLNAFLYECEQSIELEVLRSAESLLLHAKDLLINTESISLDFLKKSMVCKKLKWNEKQETVEFIFPEKIKPGKYTLRFNFQGQLTDSLKGFYRARYFHEGQEKYLAVTQFEATDARRAFPCFDEPSKKATFDVIFHIPEHLTAISNTLPVKTETLSSGGKSVGFSRTPKMSTYLLAFVVGEFEFIEATTKDGVLVRVFVTPGKLDQAKFALHCGVKFLEFFNEFYGLKYPLNSLDMVGIPDFAAGAMENWGAVTYRETQLLVDELNSSTSTKQWVALTIAHELAHQWFGNLVTMEWWTHLWLNEGFASFMEYVAVDSVFPEWNIWDQFVHIDFNTALDLDSLASSHPIEVEVKHPDEIGEIFDSISYNKGASVIRMLAEYLGPKAFQKGLKHYLKTHSYANAKTQDLWKALEKISGKPVVNLMKNWVGKTGYPVVAVKQTSKGLELSQTRFFSSKFERLKNKSKDIWPVPLKLIVGSKTQEFYLNKSKALLPTKQQGELIKINLGELTPIRVSYSTEQLEKLKPSILSNKLESVDRLGIIRDAFALSESGLMTLSSVLNLSLAYKNERSYVVLAEIASQFQEIYSLFTGHPAEAKLSKFFLEFYSPLVNFVGFDPKENDSHEDKLQRPLVLSQAGFFKNQSVVNFALENFESRNKISGDLKGLVLNLNILYGDKKVFEILLEDFKNEKNAEDRNRLMRALGQVRNSASIKTLLSLQTTNRVRLQEGPTFLAMLYANPKADVLAWEFFKKNYDHYEKHYGQGGHTFDRIISLNGKFKTEDFLKDFKDFFRKRKVSGGKRAVEQVTERVKSNIDRVKRDSKNLQDFLSE